MTYYNPLDMHPEDRQKFLDWFEAEDMDLGPLDVAAEGFSVHHGFISGKQILRTSDGSALVFNDSVVRVPFKFKQRNPLPEFEYTTGMEN